MFYCAAEACVHVVRMRIRVLWPAAARALCTPEFYTHAHGLTMHN